MTQQHTAALSRHLARTIEDVRADFNSFTDSFNGLSVKRSQFAPQFMAAFKDWQWETGRSFVAFVRELDPTMPVTRAEYPKHRSFQAALYLRRIAEAPHTVAGRGERRTVTPFKVLAKTVRTLAQLAPPHNAEAVVAAVVKATGWHQRDTDRLRKAVDKAKPLAPVLALVQPQAPRLVRGHRTHGAGREPLAVAADHKKRAATA